MDALNLMEIDSILDEDDCIDYFLEFTNELSVTPVAPNNADTVPTPVAATNSATTIASMCTSCGISVAKPVKARNFICSICDKSYTSEGWLNRHLAAAHGKSEKGCTIATGELPEIVSAVRQKMVEDFMLNNTDDGKDILQDVERLSDDSLSSIIVEVASHQDVVRYQLPNSPLPRHTTAHLMRFISRTLGAKSKSEGIKTSSEIEKLPRSNQALQALYYVCGFLLRKLKSRKWDAKTIDILNEWSVPSEGMPCQWTDLQGRGGLNHVSEEFFALVTEMDSIATDTLNCVNTNCNVINLLMCNMLEHDVFSAHCEKMNLNCELAYQLSMSFVKVRCKAFIKAEVQQTASASLRQNLTGKTKKKV